MSRPKCQEPGPGIKVPLIRCIEVFCEIRAKVLKSEPENSPQWNTRTKSGSKTIGKTLRSKESDIFEKRTQCWTSHAHQSRIAVSREEPDCRSYWSMYRREGGRAVLNEVRGKPRYEQEQSLESVRRMGGGSENQSFQKSPTRSDSRMNYNGFSAGIHTSHVHRPLPDTSNPPRHNKYHGTDPRAEQLHRYVERQSSDLRRRKVRFDEGSNVYHDAKPNDLSQWTQNTASNTSAFRDPGNQHIQGSPNRRRNYGVTTPQEADARRETSFYGDHVLGQPPHSTAYPVQQVRYHHRQESTEGDGRYTTTPYLPAQKGRPMNVAKTARVQPDPKTAEDQGLNQMAAQTAAARDRCEAVFQRLSQKTAAWDIAGHVNGLPGFEVEDEPVDERS